VIAEEAHLTDADSRMNAEFKTRLYDHYLTQHVLLNAESVKIALAQRFPYLRWMIASCMPPDRTARILDLGCGYGAILLALREAQYRSVTGVDVSSEQVELARHLGLEDVHCQDVNAFLRGVPDETYNVVIAFDILEHFTKPDLLALMDNLHRILAPGGRLIVHVPNGEGLFPGAVLYGDLTHELAFTRSSLRQLAGTASFGVLAVKEEAPIVHGLFSLIRSLIWHTGSFFLRLLSVAETGEGFRSRPLSCNLLAVLERV